MNSFSVLAILLAFLVPAAVALWFYKRLVNSQAQVNQQQQQIQSLQQQLQQSQNQFQQSHEQLEQFEHMKQQMLGSLNLLFDKLGELDNLFAQQAEGVNHALDNVAQQALSSEELSEHALKEAEQASEELPRLSKTVNEFSVMNDALQELQKLMLQVSALASDIAKIADESRMLSLNASIEAARAGEVGRGFAVVATAVTDLAEKSAAASSEINRFSLNGQSKVEALLSDSNRVATATRSFLENFTDMYEDFRQGIHTAHEAGSQLNSGLKGFHSTYANMNSASKDIFEQLNNQLTSVVGYCNGTELIDVTVAQSQARLYQYDALIDVRRPDEFNDDLGHIEGAQNINVQDPAFEQQLTNLDKDKDYLWICRSGGRSKRAALTALRNGFTGKCHNMTGGMLAWKKAGYSSTRE